MTRQLILTLILSLSLNAAFADTPTIGAPVPSLDIADRGELVIKGDDFDFIAWTSGKQPGKVHVIQYFGATLGDRDVFAPFTDLIQKELEPGSVHVTTILNMDAAMWGTSGMVMSELKKNKSQHPEATMVVDEDGKGVEAWGLGKKGTGLLIVDRFGMVKFFSPTSIPEDQLAATIELIRENM